MGDREKASLRLQFNPQIRLELPGWSYMVPPSPPTPDCWHFRELDDALDLTPMRKLRNSGGVKSVDAFLYHDNCFRNSSNMPYDSERLCTNPYTRTEKSEGAGCAVELELVSTPFPGDRGSLAAGEGRGSRRGDFQIL